MSNMSRNNSVNSLMGFSVHQPQLGAMLEFFPAMGSQQLDEMIDAYVPGNMSILDKRTTVTMEFFEHSMATGELFKFFMVTPVGTAESPAGSLQDSGYGSAFASPVISEPRWSASTSKKARIANARGAAATTTDFSHIPGMKIMTRDGQDVTNSASRGCKTKEQRDHAHLMRIMKACESCKKKKVRCDPSHKRAAVPSASDSKVKKASKKSASSARTIAASVPPITTTPQQAFDASFDAFMPSPSFDVAEQDSWEQFVMYDVDEVVVAPNVDVDYDFFYDPAGHFSPSASFASSLNSGSSSSSASPSQPFTPTQTANRSSPGGLADSSFSKDVYISSSDAGSSDVTMPSLPYMSSDGFDSRHYVDFALYSPGSTASLDDDLSSYSQELKTAASSPQQGATGGAHFEKQSVLRNVGSSSVSRDRVADNGLESRSAFAQMDEYGFDLGRSQGAQLISGMSHGRRRRVRPTSQSGEDIHRVVISSQGLSFSGLPHVDDSLVPRAQQDIPQPPRVQQQANIVIDARVASDAQHSGPAAGGIRRTGIVDNATLQRLRNTTAVLASQAADNRERPDWPAATSVMASETCSQTDRSVHKSVSSLASRHDVFDNAKIRTYAQTMSTTATMSSACTATLVGAVEQTVLVAPRANNSSEKHRRQQQSIEVSEPEAMSTDAGGRSLSFVSPMVPSALDGASSLEAWSPVSSRSVSTKHVESPLPYTTIASQGSTVLIAILVAVGVLMIAYALQFRRGLVASLALSAHVVQITTSLMKLRTISAGPLKPNTSVLSYDHESSPLPVSRGRSQSLDKTVGNVQSALPRGIVRKLGGLEFSSIASALLSQSTRWPVRGDFPFLTSSIVGLR